jgi:AcrR family transcriptional regulator
MKEHARRARRTRRLPRAERRQAIVRAATDAFAAAGFAATSVAAVARAAGVTPLILYRHFDSKDALYRAALEQASERLSAAMSEAIEPDGVAVVAPRAVLAAARRDPGAFRLLWRHSAREAEFDGYASELREQVVAGARAALAPRVSRGSLEWASRALVDYLVAAVLNWLEFGDAQRDEQFAAATNAALRAGIRAWSAGGAGARAARPRRAG